MAPAEEYYNTSLSTCTYLAESLVKQEPLDHVLYISQVAKAQTSARQVQMVYYVDGMVGREARMVEKRLPSYLENKWHCPYPNGASCVPSFATHYYKEQQPLYLGQSSTLGLSFVSG